MERPDHCVDTCQLFGCLVCWEYTVALFQAALLEE